MVMKLLVWTKPRRCHYEKALARLGVNKEKARTELRLEVYTPFMIYRVFYYMKLLTVTLMHLCSII